MSTATNTARGNELSVKESGFLGRTQASGAVTHPQLTTAQTYDMS